MVNPGAFHGSRKDFLLAEKQGYAEAIKHNYAGDFLSNLNRRYLKRYPISLPHDHEPSAEHLASVNDNDADPEDSGDEYSSSNEVTKLIDQRKKVLPIRILITLTFFSHLFVLQQIRRWMAYQYRKDQDISAKESGEEDPFAILLHQLTGVGVKKPRKKAGFHYYSKDYYYTTIKAAFDERVTRDSVPKNEWPKLRSSITRSLFNNMDPDVQRMYNEKALSEHKAAVEKWETQLKSGPSQKPEDQQRCIQRLSAFVEPIIELVSAATGMQVSFVAGGPEPADGGRLNIISAHSHINRNGSTLSFGSTERQGYKSSFVPLFAQYLKKVYSPAQCRARALPVQGPSSGDLGVGEIENVLIDHVDWPSSESGPVSLPTTGLYTIKPNSPEPSTQPIMSANTQLSTPAESPPGAQIQATEPSVEPIPEHSPYLHLRASPPRSSPPGDNGGAVAETVGGRGSSIAKPGVVRAASPDEDHECESNSRAAKKARISKCNGKRAATTTTQKSRHSDTATAPMSSAPPPVGTDASAPTTIQLPPDAPKYLKNSFALFTSEDLGMEWQVLVNMWLSCELNPVNFTTGKLGTTARPACIADWIARARSPTYRPAHIRDLKAFEASFWKWWRSLQPEWRIEEGEEKLSVEEGHADWELLKVFGANGITSVVAALFFWGRHACEDGATAAVTTRNTNTWLSAANDVSWVLKHLASPSA
ncbi:hypothetical protein BJ138DRAFT_1018673 [Hygrophoropsis aurantiaca]|uniref:Uncharacterized protein n=1 Tax=Hygrophoropsis aurantiaca TaxID=72124 RepID=A0ACB7ZUB8_9AGAM|nr:hypothetical protein BJ138DRAFT_1018673 [Hygrophoropsis aurantiaca]